MKIIKKIFAFKFNFTQDTLIAFALGAIVIALSFIMNLLSGETAAGRIWNFLILDIFIRAGTGFIFTVVWVFAVRQRGVDFFGIKREKSVISLITGLILAGLLLFQFLMQSRTEGAEVLFRPEAIFPIVYIMVAGIFEMTFLYGFLRKIFEESFGIIPGVLLTAAFYSFHHAGFQPEFIKLFFVGIMYASIFRLTDNILIVFPFFWGIGAVWDVLVNFGTNALEGPLALYRALATLAVMGAGIMILRSILGRRTER